MRRNPRANSGPGLLTINGLRVARTIARYVYRCEECHAELAYNNAGVICSASRSHRGFIHRDEAAKIQQNQQQNTNKLEQFYTIENGKVVIKNGN